MIAGWQRRQVWHEGTEPRLVLIVDVWHPDLSAAARRRLNMGSVDSAKNKHYRDRDPATSSAVLYPHNAALR